MYMYTRTYGHATAYCLAWRVQRPSLQLTLTTTSMVGLYIIAATLLSRYRKFLFLRCQDAL